MKYSGMMQDQNSNYPSAAYEALKSRRGKERNDLALKAKLLENTASSASNVKRQMSPPKKSLKPRKVL